jgi:hypothetical protein
VRFALVILVTGCRFSSPFTGADTDAPPGMHDAREIDARVIDAMPDAPGASTLTLHATVDAYTRQQFPDENHGIDADLRTGSGSTIDRANRLLVAFDVTAIPAGCQMTAAHLNLYYYAEDFIGVSPTLSAYRVTAAWTETAVTWNSRTAAQAWATTGGDHATAESSVVASAATFGWLAWDVTAMTGMWRSNSASNFGVMVAEPNDDPGNGGRKLFYSMQSSNTQLRPFISVDCL